MCHDPNSPRRHGVGRVVGGRYIAKRGLWSDSKPQPSGLADAMLLWSPMCGCSLGAGPIARMRIDLTSNCLEGRGNVVAKGARGARRSMIAS